MLLGLETFSYDLAFAYGKMDILDFIKRAAELGLDGVQINAEGADLAHLGSDDPGFLRDVRAMIEEFGMFVELDTCDTDPQHLTRVLNICYALGADVMRVYSSLGGDVKEDLEQAIEDFRHVINLCADYGVRISFENHEFESSHDVLEVVVAPHLLRYFESALELRSFGWQDLAGIPDSEAQRQELLVLQDQAVVDSVEYVKKLNC